ncbi:CRISPR-associated endoribonuclease Cas6 [Archaeoglobus sp.]
MPSEDTSGCLDGWKSKIKMVDAVRVEIEFKSSESKYLRMFSGAYVRGFVYWVIARNNRSLASELHENKNLAPYATSPVFGEKGVVEKLEEGKTYRFSVSFFVPEIGEVIKEYITSTGEIFFAGTSNRLKTARVQYFDFNIDEFEPIEKFAVNFVTPCYFRIPSNKYRFLPLPYPPLMFRSLARLYEAFVAELPLNYRSWLDKHAIAISGCNIRTEKVTLKKGMWTVGFIGRANFTIPKDTYNEEFARITAALLKFGETSNVGGGRTSGFGVMRVENMESATDLATSS